MISGFLCPTSSITVEFKVALVVIRQGPIGYSRPSAYEKRDPGDPGIPLSDLKPVGL